jgi:integrase
LGSFAVEHLKKKAEARKCRIEWVAAAEMHLSAAISYFCNGGEPLQKDSDGALSLAGIIDRELSTISVEDIEGYTRWLRSRPNGRGGTLSPSSQRKYLNSLSNLYRRAISQGRVQSSRNPVADYDDKPQDNAGRGESRWLEVHDAARLLRAAHEYTRKPKALITDTTVIHAVIAAMLLTGGRPSEVLGLEWSDISFERATVTFRPNKVRGLKTARSYRTVQMWPQLREILEVYAASRSDAERGGLVFRSARNGGKIQDIRKSLDEIAERAGFNRGDVRPYCFRHTYCAARLQTLDGGAPVSPYTVASELGHDGLALVNRVYGHLGRMRHRSEVVEYREKEEKEHAA